MAELTTTYYYLLLLTTTYYYLLLLTGIPPHGNRIAFVNAYSSCIYRFSRAFFNAYTSTLNIEHSTPIIQQSTSDIQHPTSNTQRSTSNIQHSTFKIQHPTSNSQHSYSLFLNNCFGKATVTNNGAYITCNSWLQPRDRRHQQHPPRQRHMASAGELEATPASAPK